jgi:hypothetical protein
MRWKSDPLEDRLGEHRVVKKFLIFPRKLDEEWRWLETSYIVQKVCREENYTEFGPIEGKCKWFNEHWLDTPKSCFDIYRTKLR